MQQKPYTHLLVTGWLRLCLFKAPIVPINGLAIPHLYYPASPGGAAAPACCTRRRRYVLPPRPSLLQLLRLNLPPPLRPLLLRTPLMGAGQSFQGRLRWHGMAGSSSGPDQQQMG